MGGLLVLPLSFALLVAIVVLAWVRPAQKLVSASTPGIRVIHVLFALLVGLLLLGLLTHSALLLLMAVVSVLVVVASSSLARRVTGDSWDEFRAARRRRRWTAKPPPEVRLPTIVRYQLRNVASDLWAEFRHARRHRVWTAGAPSDVRLGAILRHHALSQRGHVYLGTDHGNWVMADPEHAVLVLGPPRQGKTTAVVIPTTLAASGPVVSTSTKLDVLQHTAATRGQVGTCWLFDPSGLLVPPPGARRLCWSPVLGCKAWDVAVKLSHDIVTTARPAGGMKDSGHWAERAAALLSGLMHVAALDGKGMRQVLAWTSRHDHAEAMEILERHDAVLAVDTLEGIDRTGETEQAGIFSTASSALAVYRSEAALAVTDAPNFSPQEFVSSRDTVYVTASSQHQRLAAPLVVALLAEIQAATFAVAARQSWHGNALAPPMLWMLDEVANIAPIPELPAIVSEGGGQGLSWWRACRICRKRVSDGETRRMGSCRCLAPS
jgi:type IV secretion system protein VirD4